MYIFLHVYHRFCTQIIDLFLLFRPHRAAARDLGHRRGGERVPGAFPAVHQQLHHPCWWDRPHHATTLQCQWTAVSAEAGGGVLWGGGLLLGRRLVHHFSASEPLYLQKLEEVSCGKEVCWMGRIKEVCWMFSVDTEKFSSTVWYTGISLHNRDLIKDPPFNYIFMIASDSPGQEKIVRIYH